MILMKFEDWIKENGLTDRYNSANEMEEILIRACHKILDGGK